MMPPAALTRSSVAGVAGDELVGDAPAGGLGDEPSPQAVAPVRDRVELKRLAHSRLSRH